MMGPLGDELDNLLATEEARLVAERNAALEAFRCKPTAANRKAYTKANESVEQFLKARLEPIRAERVFPGLPDVLEYLLEDGWKISQSTLYEHRDAAKIRAEPSGSFTLPSVQDYARIHLRKQDGTPGAAVAEDLGAQKMRAEINRITHDGALRELKLRQELGELIPKSVVEVELAERAGNLKSYFNAIARSSAGRIIKIVGGDAQKSADLIAWMLAVNAKAFDNYARPIQGTEEDEG